MHVCTHTLDSLWVFHSAMRPVLYPDREEEVEEEAREASTRTKHILQSPELQKHDVCTMILHVVQPCMFASTANVEYSTQLIEETASVTSVCVHAHTPVGASAQGRCVKLSTVCWAATFSNTAVNVNVVLTDSCPGDR